MMLDSILRTVVIALLLGAGGLIMRHEKQLGVIEEQMRYVSESMRYLLGPEGHQTVLMRLSAKGGG